MHFSSKKQKKSYQTATLFVHSSLALRFCKKNQPTTNPISPRRIGYILRWGDMGLVGKKCWCLFFHHLAHAFQAFLVGDGDEVDTCRQFSHVDVKFIALALHAEHLLP